MPTSDEMAGSIADYPAALPADRRDALEALCRTILEAVPGAEERFSSGMPASTREYRSSSSSGEDPGARRPDACSTAASGTRCLSFSATIGHPGTGNPTHSALHLLTARRSPYHIADDVLVSGMIQQCDV